MKKKLFVVCLALSMLAMVTGTVLAAPSAGGYRHRPCSARREGHERHRVPLQGVRRVLRALHSQRRPRECGDGGEDYGLHCRQLDSETVRCLTASRKAQGDVTVTFGGSTFLDAHVAPFTRPTKYCYAAFDWWL
jgi:hypothetical protein